MAITLTRWPTPPQDEIPLVLCADGGGSKICVVIRSPTGMEVRGYAGSCNIQSVGYQNASQAILLATYRALASLPRSALPPNLILPQLPPSGSAPTLSPPRENPLNRPVTPTSRPSSPDKGDLLPPLNVPVFRAAWLGLAGVNSNSDAFSFTPYACAALNLSPKDLYLTNDVNLLAAPALQLQNIHHVVTVVCGTGTMGRTIRRCPTLSPSSGKLPLEDVAVSRGWGYTLCDEGSAFWIGRLAIRNLLALGDRLSSSQIYSGPPPPLLPFHEDLLAYFGTQDPMEIVELASLTGRWAEDGVYDIGSIAGKRNAMIAGAARVVLKWAFPGDVETILPSPTATAMDTTQHVDPTIASSHREALRIAKRSIEPLIDLTLSLLGDQSVVIPQYTALALGGGLMKSEGYKGLLLDGLRKEGIQWGHVQMVDDAAGVGALGLASVEFA